MEACLLIIPYVFSIVALSILLTAIVKNVQQFNAVIPIVSVSFAMIGGAYWPLEIVESTVFDCLIKNQSDHIRDGSAKWSGAIRVSVRRTIISY